MSIIQWINAAVVIIGIPTIVKVLLTIGSKLKTLDDIESDIKTNIRPDLKDVRERFFALEGKTSNLFKSASPISLTSEGEKILIESGFKKYLDENKDSLIEVCEKNKDLKTPYDIQQAVFEFFDNHIFSEDVENNLKNAAFSAGISTDIVKRIGAIYFRKFCLDKHGFKEEDLDKPKVS